MRQVRWFVPVRLATPQSNNSNVILLAWKITEERREAEAAAVKLTLVMRH